MVRLLANRAKTDPKRVVFAEADHLDVLKAAQIALEDNIAFPILINGQLIVCKTQVSLNLKRNFQLKWLQISELIKVHFIMQLNIIQIMIQALEQLGNIKIAISNCKFSSKAGHLC